MIQYVWIAFTATEACSQQGESLQWCPFLDPSMQRTQKGLETPKNSTHFWEMRASVVAIIYMDSHGRVGASAS